MGPVGPSVDHDTRGVEVLGRSSPSTKTSETSSTSDLRRYRGFLLVSTLEGPGVVTRSCREPRTYVEGKLGHYTTFRGTLSSTSWAGCTRSYIRNRTTGSCTGGSSSWSFTWTHGSETTCYRRGTGVRPSCVASSVREDFFHAYTCQTHASQPKPLQSPQFGRLSQDPRLGTLW